MEQFDNLIFILLNGADMEAFISIMLPESILEDNRLTFLERLILIEIMSLCKKNGYCWATNKYFMNKFDCTKQTISKSISSLSKYNYIVIEIDNKEKNNSKRIIKLSEVLRNKLTGIKENLNASIQNNFNYYNKYNNKKSINNEIYKIDDEGNEYWHGIKIESQELTEEERLELEDLFKEFKE